MCKCDNCNGMCIYMSDDQSTPLWFKVFAAVAVGIMIVIYFTA